MSASSLTFVVHLLYDTEVTEQPTYRGVPLSQIVIASVRWSEAQAEHLQTRTIRYARTETNLRVEWVYEAIFDADRQLFIPNVGTSLGLLGLSISVRRVLKVWLQPVDMSRGEWDGMSAAKVNKAQENHYRKGASDG